MKILTKELAKTIPPLYATENPDSNPTVVAKFFNPCGAWTWYVTEASATLTDGREVRLSDLDITINGRWQLVGTDAAKVKEITFFGLVDGDCDELGYFSFREMAMIRLPFGLMLERDLYFSPCPLSEVRGK